MIKNNTKLIKPSKHPDYWLLLPILLLMGIGLAMIYSASPTVALASFGDSFFYVKRHLVYLGIGSVALWLGYRIPMARLKLFAFPGFLCCLGLLMIVFIPGVGQNVGGASRWIQMGPFSFQPSEVTKLFTILFLALALTHKKESIQKWKEGLLPLLGLLLFTSLLVLKQPDLGTTLIILWVAFIMLFVGGAKIIHLLSIFLASLLGLIGLILMHPYQLKRVLAFIDPWQDPGGIGFHIIQSLVAVGSGGVLGLGLGNSRQKFFYLPQQFTDFIYAILCEELGFIGGILVIGLFTFFMARGIRLIRYTLDPFARLVALGVVSWISLQAFTNCGVVIHLLPTTGIPLPFISFGGTSLIVMSFAVGLLLNISRSLSPPSQVAIMKRAKNKN